MVGWVIGGGVLAVLVIVVFLIRGGSGKKSDPSQDVDEESIATKRIQ